MTAHASLALLATALALLCGVNALPESPLNGWVLADDVLPNATAPFTFTLALRPARPDALATAFDAITDPSNATGQFRRYLDDDAIRALVTPPGAREDAAARAVRRWLRTVLPAAGGSDEFTVAPLGPHGDLLAVTAPVHAVERLFGGAALRAWRHPRREGPGATTLVRAAGPAPRVPPALAPWVRAVHGVADKLPVPPRRLGLGPAGDTVGKNDYPGVLVNPTVLAAQYHISNPDGGYDADAPGQGIAAFEDAQFRQTDVTAFDKAYGLPHVTVKVSGPNDGGYFGEAGLDTQYLPASGRGLPTWFLSQETFDMTSWCTKVLGMRDGERPSVLSVSWGSGESGFEPDHMKTANACFQKAALKGISIFTASGDQGTGAKGGPFGFGCKKFDPTWPATSPYLTAVGGTYLDKTGGDGTEHAWAGSGGGFSALMDRPSWQEDTVDAYLNASGSALPSAGLWTRTGRAIPDVAALATNFQIYSGGSVYGTLTGTSAATPTFAGLVAAVNALRAKDGKATVGFVNPVLYKAGAHLGFDVTDGNNKNPSCPAGFPARAGWDAVSGLGTPTFDKLKELLLED